MDSFEERRRRSKGARARQEARKQRRSQMAAPMDKSRRASASDRFTRTVGEQVWLQDILSRIQLFIRDLVWHLFNNPLIIRSILAVAALVFVIYGLVTILSGNIMPRVQSMGVDLGGLSAQEAESLLEAAWRDEIGITLIVNGEVYDTIRPELLGVRFDAEATAKAAKDAGLGAFPFGESIKPTVTFDRLTAQTFLLDTADLVDTLPYNAGYTVRDGQVVGVEGREGYMVDVALTLEDLERSLSDIVNQRRLELIMTPLSPDVRDPDIYMDDVIELLGPDRSPTLIGYDPYLNQVLTWPIPLEEYLGWISASRSGITLREDAFRPYVDLLSQSLVTDDGAQRYLAPDETANLLRQAISSGRRDLSLRIRYRDTVYTVVSGDTGFAISRKTGIPFRLIEEYNPDKDLSILSPGEEIRIPTRDVTMLEQPIPNKRIVVDLEAQYLIAYENNEIKFQWEISSGVDNAPTSPGIYQILNHDPVAYGGSINYCDDVTLACGQWEMNWFMGIYEVFPGLLNGFHGSVLLPNGGILGDGVVGIPATFGCVMSPDDQAKALYDWAEVGTVVEIISDDFPPYSDIARISYERIRNA